MSARRGTDGIAVVRDRLAGWAWATRAVAVLCAVVLLLALVAPRGLARTSWYERGANDRALAGDPAPYAFNDSPAGYVGLVSLCGLAALAALLVAAWSRRARVAAALLAAVAFACAAWVAVAYARNLAGGRMGLEGDLDASMPPSAYVVDPPEMLPFFVVVAALGALAALALAVADDAWPGRAPIADLTTPPWLAGDGADDARFGRPGMHGEGSAR